MEGKFVVFYLNVCIIQRSFKDDFWLSYGTTKMFLKLIYFLLKVRTKNRFTM
jgi:hypothetical protein